jgi:hypothetical protein
MLRRREALWNFPPALHFDEHEESLLELELAAGKDNGRQSRPSQVTMD